MSKHVAFDLDDVILDFVGGLIDSIQKEYGVSIDRDGITDFNLGPFLDPIVGEDWWGWLRRRDWLWPNFPAVDGAIGTLERLRREDYYLEIVTSKPEWADYAVWKWMGKWRPPVRKVTITRHDDDKSKFTDAPILVDDKEENIEQWTSNETKTGAILFTRPHNQNVRLWSPKARRAFNWKEVYDLIQMMNG